MEKKQETFNSNEFFRRHAPDYNFELDEEANKESEAPHVQHAKNQELNQAKTKRDNTRSPII